MSRPKHRVAYLSMDSLEGFYSYEQATVEALAGRGIAAETVSWRAPGVDWSAFDLVVIRTTWDYQDHLPDFLQVLEEIDAATELENPLELCRWNVRKSYLRELEERGVPIVPTRFCGEEPPTRALFDELSCEELVLKPQVGANADRTFRLERAAFAAREAELREAFAGRPYLAQPFLSEVVAEGEYSLFYFSGQYSHCVLKSPAPGDFRVQEEHGGRIRAASPPPELRAAAERSLRGLPVEPLYARPDFVRVGNEWRLMELELVEPSLYFEHDAEAPERFASALQRRLER